MNTSHKNEPNEPIEKKYPPLKVGVIGLGSWGTAMANVFADAGNIVSVWGRDEAVRHSLRTKKENQKYLKGISLNPSLHVQDELRTCLLESDLIVCAIPVQEIRKVFFPVTDCLADKPILNTCKGIEIGSDYRVSQIFAELTPSSPYSILSGPSFAEEVAMRLPTAVTIASRNNAMATQLQEILSTPYFRIYTSTDLIGVEIAGALKNVIAIASGIVSGLKLGYNAMAALINRGIIELARFGKILGAEPFTFMGLSGMGDLVLTCTGPLSRNRRVGLALAEGKKLEEVCQNLGGVAEGVYTARSAWELAQKSSTELPIIFEMHQILYHNKPPKQVVIDLMSRDLKEEILQ